VKLKSEHDQSSPEQMKRAARFGVGMIGWDNVVEANAVIYGNRNYPMSSIGSSPSYFQQISHGVNFLKALLFATSAEALAAFPLNWLNLIRLCVLSCKIFPTSSRLLRKKSGLNVVPKRFLKTELNLFLSTSSKDHQNRTVTSI
jgi:hypothetical protein